MTARRVITIPSSPANPAITELVVELSDTRVTCQRPVFIATAYTTRRVELSCWRDWALHSPENYWPEAKPVIDLNMCYADTGEPVDWEQLSWYWMEGAMHGITAGDQAAGRVLKPNACLDECARLLRMPVFLLNNWRSGIWQTTKDANEWQAKFLEQATTLKGRWAREATLARFCLEELSRASEESQG